MKKLKSTHLNKVPSSNYMALAYCIFFPVWRSYPCYDTQILWIWVFCGCVLSLTSGMYSINLGYINGYKEF